MSAFGKRLKSCREKIKKSDSKWTQKYVADKIGVARVTYTAYENGTKMPPFDTINNIAELFGVTTDYLMGRSENTSDESKRPTQSELTDKDERDIAKRMANIRKDLEEGTGEDGLNFMGEPMSEDAKESLLEALEYAERQATRINKKFAPNKYKNRENQ